MQRLHPWSHCGRSLIELAINLVRFMGASFRSRTTLAAENLFLRKRLALYHERQLKP